MSDLVTPIATIAIATYQHAEYLPAAIESALAQTVPCEVIVVDDGSTDDTAAILDGYADRVRVIRLPHGGPSAARNAGIDAARGEFLMLLDADDIIEPDKVEAQLAEFTPEIGMMLCDVRIEDEVKGKVTKASVQYRYDDKGIGGWIQPLLKEGNFIPIMSPLIRRSVLSDTIRFDESRIPEDWHFWHAVAGVARVRYLPRVLATYKHRRTGRSRLPKQARAYSPHLTHPLRLNLGCGTPTTRSWHPIEGMMNLDKALGWRFEDGLPEFVDRSVSGVTISHALMYVAESDWPAFFAELARVLAPGGVVRITEDETSDRRSSRFGGWRGSEPAITKTTPALVRQHLEAVGLTVYDVTAETTHYQDRSLCQAQHGAPPDVFFIEGVRQAGVLFSPHSDDETLFAAFTILRYRPAVVVCFGSAGDYGSTETREAETRDAMTVLGGGPVEQWNGGDLVAQMRAYDERCHPDRVWAPSSRASHPDHVAVAMAARQVFGARVTAYHTYDLFGKFREGDPVQHEPAWTSQKLRALARYQSQILHPRANQFFQWDLDEYQEHAS